MMPNRAGSHSLLLVLGKNKSKRSNKRRGGGRGRKRLKREGRIGAYKKMARVVFANDKPRDWCTTKHSSLNAAEPISHSPSSVLFFRSRFGSRRARGKPSNLARGNCRILFNCTRH